LRGQVGLILAVIFSFIAKALLERKPFRAGMWLSGAITLKIIPAYLLLLPLVRRSRPMVLGCATGLLVGLVLIPLAVLGPQRTANAYKSIFDQVLLAGALSDHKGLLGAEVTGIRSTSNCSPLSVIHALRNPNPSTRPDDVGTATRAGHVAIVLGLTAATLFAYMKGSSNRRFFKVSSEKQQGSESLETAPLNTSDRLDISSERRDVLLLATLSTVTIIASPVYHPHYFSQSVFPVMVLMAIYFERHPHPTLSRPVWGLFGIILFAYIFWLITERMPIRDFGPVLFSSLALWAACTWELTQTAPERADRNLTLEP